MKFVLIFFLLFSFFISNSLFAEIKDCETIQDKLKKKNCLIDNKAEKLEKKIKEKSSEVKEKVSGDVKNVLEKHKKFQKESPKTLWDIFKKIKN